MARPLKGITRIDYVGISTRGWMVRLTRAGKRQQQFFGDKTYGGKAKALAAAKQCYAGWVEKAGPVSTTRNQKTSRNSSGKVGVHLIHNRDARWENAGSFGYCASWIDDQGARRKVSFAWKRYGKKVAWELACLAREHQISDRDKVMTLHERQSTKKSTRDKRK